MVSEVESPDLYPASQSSVIPGTSFMASETSYGLRGVLVTGWRTLFAGVVVVLPAGFDGLTP